MDCCLKVGGVYEYIFNCPISRAANIPIMWKRECENPVRPCCSDLADFCTYDVITAKFFLENLLQNGIKFRMPIFFCLTISHEIRLLFFLFLTMKKFLFCLFLLAVFGRQSLLAQSQSTAWLASFNTIKIGKKTSIHTDIQWRSADEWKYTQTLLVRSGLNFHIDNRFILTGGYAYVGNRRVINGIDGFVPEHRIWEQLLFNHKLSHANISHRLRLEQRFLSNVVINNNQLKHDETVFASRIRYFFRSVLPLQRTEKFSKGWFAALQDEVFVNIGNTSHVNGKSFDQNRLYLAVGYRLSPSFDLETGYLNQYISGRGNAFANHVAQVAGYLRLP